jgi:hypothetical protein
MNFNPMDLIKLKEALYARDSEEFNAITDFITKLVDIQCDWKEKDFKVLGETYGKSFVNRQKMIEHAYKISKLEVFNGE